MTMPAKTASARHTRSIAAVVALVATLGFAAPIVGQAPITSVGLGYQVQPVDGRSAALGGAGLGLLGGSFSVRNPADLLLHREPGFGISFTGESVDLEGGNDTTGRQRFSSIRALIPFGGWAVGISFAGEFDQDWSTRFQDTLFLADGSVPFNESREHDGGISAVDVSLARQIGPLGIGVSAQRLTGSLRQSFFRQFDLPLGDAPQLGSTGGSQELSYKAWRFKAGGLINVSDRIAVSGSFGMGGTLSATIQDSDLPVEEFDLPPTVEIGGSARVTNDLLFAGGGGWGRWSDVDPGDAGFTSHDVTWMGGGLEYGGLTFLGGRLPVRLGYRQADLPFSPSSETLTENAITGGFGWEFQQGLAVMDLTVEAGTRGDLAAAGLEESFTRMTLSFTLRQRSP